MAERSGENPEWMELGLRKAIFRDAWRRVERLYNDARQLARLAGRCPPV